MTDANARVLGNDKDVLQHIMPVGNVTRNVLPTIPEMPYTDLTQFNTTNYQSLTDFMKVYMSPSVYGELRIGAMKPGAGGPVPITLRDYISITYFDPSDGMKEVTAANLSLANIRNYKWAITINFGPAALFDSSAIRIGFCMSDSNQDYAISYDNSGETVELIGNTAGGFGARYLGKRTGGIPASVTEYTRNTIPYFEIRVLQTGKTIVDNFTTYGPGTAVFDGRHGVTGSKFIDNTDYVRDNYLSISGDPAKDESYIWFKAIDVPASGDAVYVPYTYFATAYSSAQNGQEAPSAVGLSSTPERVISEANTAGLATAYASLSISDGKKTWAGANFAKNPYIKVTFDQNANPASNETFLNPSSQYYMGDRNILVANPNKEAGASADVPDLVVEKLNNGGTHRDVRSGLVITKKHMRSTSLQFTITLMAWRKEAGEFTVSAGSSVSVKVPMTVANDFIQISSESGTTAVGGMATGTLQAVTSSGAKSVGLHAPANNAIDSVLYDTTLKFQSTSNYDTVNSAAGAYTDWADQNYYREKAFFSVRSVHNTFSAEERARLSDASGSAINTISPNSIYGYFGGSGSSAKTTFQTNFGLGSYDADANPTTGYDPNPNFDKFFQLDLDSDNTHFNIIPVNKTFLNFDQATEKTRDAWLAEYNLAEDANGIYYPLRLLAYDDFAGTGFAGASYYGVCIKVYIRNSTPTVTPSYKTNSEGLYPMANGYQFPVYLRRVDSALYDGDGQEQKYLINLAAITSEMDIGVKDSGYYMSKEDVEALEDAFERLTTDYMLEPEIRVLGTNNPTITLTLDEDKNNLLLTVRKRPAGFDASLPAQIFSVTFKDSQNNQYAMGTEKDVTEKASVVIKIMYSNSKPQIQEKAAEVVGNQNAGNHITMKTGSSFRLVTTDYNSYMSAKDQVLYPDGTTALDLFNRREGATADMGSATGWWATQTATALSDDATITGQFKTNRGSVESPASGFIGNLAVAIDDTPWALRFDDRQIRINNYAAGSTSAGSKLLKIDTAKDRIPSLDPDYSSNSYPISLMFTATGSTNGPLKVEVPVFDDRNMSRETFVFYVTIISTAPIAKNGTGSNDPRNTFNGVDLATGEGFDENDKKYIYETSISIGETKSFKLSDFVYDLDVGEDANLGLAGNMVLPADASRYIDAVYSSASPATISITGRNHHVNTAAPYCDIQFNIYDPGASDNSEGTSVPITLRVKTWRASLALEQKALDQAGNATMKVEAASVADGGETRIRLVTNAAKSGALGVNDPVVIDTDYNGTADNNYVGTTATRYSVHVYSLLNIKDDGTIGPNIAPERLKQTEYSDYKLFSYVQGVGGEPSALVFNSDKNDSSKLFWSYVDDSRLSFMADGSSFVIYALMRTPNAAVSGENPIIREFPLYVEIEKPTEDREHSDSPGFQGSAGFKMNLTVKNSIIESADDFGISEDVSKNFLDFIGQRGDEQEYRVFDKADYENNSVLFKDADNQNLASDPGKFEKFEGDNISVATPATRYRK